MSDPRGMVWPMPTVHHDTMAAALLAETALAMGLDAQTPRVRRRAGVRVIDPVLRGFVLNELRADGLLMQPSARGRGLLVIEVQQTCDREKPYRWPIYLFLTEHWHRRRARLLVVSSRPEVVRWARRVVERSDWLRDRTTVAGPDEVPRLETVPLEKRTAGLALLSVAMHYRSRADKLLLEAAEDKNLRGVDAMGGARTYLDKLYALLPAGDQRIWEEHMGQRLGPDGQPFRFSVWLEETGRKMGREEGREEGRTDALARLSRLFSELAAFRGFEVSAAAAQRVAACISPDELEGWTRRLLVADKLEAVFEEKRPRRTVSPARRARAGRSG